MNIRFVFACTNIHDQNLCVFRSSSSCVPCVPYVSVSLCQSVSLSLSVCFVHWLIILHVWMEIHLHVCLVQHKSIICPISLLLWSVRWAWIRLSHLGAERGRCCSSHALLHSQQKLYKSFIHAITRSLDSLRNSALSLSGFSLLYHPFVSIRSFSVSVRHSSSILLLSRPLLCLLFRLLIAARLTQRWFSSITYVSLFRTH